jgi:hypothetical protein
MSWRLGGKKLLCIKSNKIQKEGEQKMEGVLTTKIIVQTLFQNYIRKILE